MKTHTVIALATLLLCDLALSDTTIIPNHACPEGATLYKEQDGKQLLASCKRWVESGGVLSAPTRQRVADGPVKIYKEVQTSTGHSQGVRVRLFTAGQFKEGKATGIWERYANDETLSVKYEVNEKAEPHGAMTELHSNGNKRAEGSFENGTKVGTWKFWDNSGKLLKEGTGDEIQKVAAAFDAQQEKKQQLAQAEQVKADAKAIEADYKQNGYPLTDSVFTPCNRAQIQALQSGGTLSKNWIPKKGQIFRADDNYYRIGAVISQSPLQLLIEGSANVTESSLQNTCMIVMTLKNRDQLKTTAAPHPGYVVKLGDTITGFKLRAIGTAKVQMKSLRSISSVGAELPNFELISGIAVAND